MSEVKRPPRTLLVKGSPSERSASLALAGIAADVWGGERVVVDLHAADVRPCAACGRCRATGVCPIDDAMPGILDELSRADVLCVASPLHFTSLSAPVIAFFSRFQPHWHAAKRGERPLGGRTRAAALVVAAGSEYPNMFVPARAVAAAAFKTLGLAFAGLAAATNTDLAPPEDNADALESAGRLGAKVLSLIS